MRNSTKKQIVMAINSFNASCEKVAGAYFWSNDNGNSSIRRNREKYLSDYKEFVHEGHKITCKLDVEQSRKNTYTRITITKDGVKTTRSIFKKILKELGCESLEWMYAIVDGIVYNVLSFKRDGEKVWFFDENSNKTKTGTFNKDVFKYQREAYNELDKRVRS